MEISFISGMMMILPLCVARTLMQPVGHTDGTAIPHGSGRFLISYASKIHTVDTYVKSAIFFGACLVVILVIGLTMKRDREEDPESSRGYGDTSDNGLEGLAQMEN